ncbi:MAG TPA: cytochrome c [Candidatus Acidoferrum sp.]|jgi:mono/diheme cytochrome c family protein|nr:cytochrome c [Candidatus Acidoferrum sp.]
MRLPKGLKQYGLIALAIPGLMLLTGISTLADASPSPSASGAPLPGDPNNGQTVYAQNCAVCHGASLEGGIGAVLNPIDKLPGIPNSLDPTFLIDIITNGRVHQATDPKQADMPAWKGKLSDQEIKDVAAYIIQQNQTPVGSAPLAPNELAKRTILWVSIGIIAMVFVTYLLAQYNMRWIARRASARRR